jgi:hypothetical protein
MAAVGVVMGSMGSTGGSGFGALSSSQGFGTARLSSTQDLKQKQLKAGEGRGGAGHVGLAELGWRASSERELRELRRLFEEADEDGSGEINFTELQQVPREAHRARSISHRAEVVMTARDWSS